MKQPINSKRAKFRLSPNEVEQLKKDETERRRRLRIVQVREQAKSVAAKIRNDVKQEREQQLLKLAEKIQIQLEEEKKETVQRLEKQYENTLHNIGMAHTQAIRTDKSLSHAEQHQATLEKKKKAETRHQEALRKMALDKAYKEYEETKHIRDRHAALEEEKKRAAEVASRPPPPPDPVVAVLDEKHKYNKAVSLTDLNAFSATHYHIPDFVVEKAPPEQQLDGKESGKSEDERTKEEIAVKKKQDHDQMIKARIRGNEALKKEKLKHEYDALMADLSLQQRADRRRRQAIVSKLPKQVFLPPDRRIEEKDDRQMAMEQAFENMYMQQMNVTGDMSLTLDPNPVPPSPPDEDEKETSSAESSPLVLSTLPALNPALRELTNVSHSQGLLPEQGKPESVLKRLLNRIKEQRSEVEVEKSQKPDRGQENKDFRQHEVDKPVLSKIRNKSSVRIPYPVEPDPQLDLSPLKSLGNDRQQRKMPQSDLVPAHEEDISTLSEESEEGFLDNLAKRLQTVESQKEYLEKKLREQQQKRHLLSRISTITTTTATNATPMLPPYSSVTTTTQLPTTSSWSSTSVVENDRYPQTSGSQTDPQTRWMAEQLVGPSSFCQTLSKPVPETEGLSGSAVPRLSLAGGDNASLYLPKTELMTTALVDSGETGSQTRKFELTFRQPLAHAEHLLPQPNQSTFSVRFPVSSHFVSSGGRPNTLPIVDHHSMFSSRSFANHPASIGLTGVRLGMSTAPLGIISDAVQDKLFTAGEGQAALRNSEGYSHADLGPFTGKIPPSSSDSLRLVSGSHSTGSAFSSAGLLYPHGKPMTSLVSGREPQSLSTSLASALTTNTPNLCLGNRGAPYQLMSFQAKLATDRPETTLNNMTAQLDLGRSEEEHLQHVRDFQRHLIEKHEQRMKMLAETRAKIEGRYAEETKHGSSLSSTLSSSGLTDPITLVPYTLHTSKFKPAIISEITNGHSSAFISSSLYPLISKDSVVTSAAGLKWHGEEQLKSTIHEASVADHGDTVMGNKSMIGTASKEKLDSIRKSLPFSNSEDAQHEEEETRNAGDAGQIFTGDDSHMSSSTERGSPAFDIPRNKSGDTGSKVSNKFIGVDSLLARAEEKRINFEQRQKDLQNQLVEIQHQKEEVMRRYHGSQQRVSTQEADLRNKLRAAQSSITSLANSLTSYSQIASSVAKAPPLRHESIGATLPKALFPSVRPMLELEEHSVTLEQSTGRAQNWATALKEYSFKQNKSGSEIYKTPESMTLEEFSIGSDSDWTGQVEGQRSFEGGQQPSSFLSSLQEESITSGKESNSVTTLSAGLEEKLSLFSLKSQDNVTSTCTTDCTNIQNRNDNRPYGRTHGDELDNLGEKDSLEGNVSWSGVLKTEQEFAEKESTMYDNGNSAFRLPPPPTRQPIPVTDYEPHELSTILEVDTPQNVVKSQLIEKASPFRLMGLTGSLNALGNTDQHLAQRKIDFGKFSTTTIESSRNLVVKSPAKGSLAGFDEQSLIEVPNSGLKTMAAGTLGTSNLNKDALVLNEKAFKPPFGVGSLGKQHGLNKPYLQQDASEIHWYEKSSDQPLGSQDSASFCGHDFHPLDFTLSSLTSHSHLADESGARRYLDFSEEEPPKEEKKDSNERVMKQARKFNQDLLTAIKLQSADVFNLSGLTLASHSSADQSQSFGL